MKRIICTVSAAAMLAGCAAGTGYTVTGDIEGLDGYVYMADPAAPDSVIDSAAVSGGRFVFKGRIEQPMLAVLYDAPDGGREQAVYAYVFLEAGDIAVSEDESGIVVSGTPSNDAYASFRSRHGELMKRYSAASTDEERAAVAREYDAMERSILDDNRTNLCGAVVLTQNFAYKLSGSEMIAEIEKFPAELQAAPLLKSAREMAEAKSRTEAGNPYIDVAQPTAGGEILELSDVAANPANKYVLVDFWASWCGPCMGEVPYLVDAYAKYHDRGFEIYGISLDKNRDAWLAAIAGKKMSWLHVSDLNGFDCQAARDYAVQAIPSNFLVETATGDIVATNLRGAELVDKIAELLD